MNKIIVTMLLLVCGTVAADHELIVVPEHDPKPVHSPAPHRHPGFYLTPYVGIGFGSGGDVIGRFTDDFGDVEKVRSGGGFNFEGGLLMALDEYTRLRFTGGYEIDGVSRINGQSSFDRVRFDLMLLRNFGHQELGVGLTAHTAINYECEVNTICSGDVHFDNALGFTAEYALTTFNMASGGGYDRRLNPLRDARIGLRFTDIEYRPRLDNNTSDFDVGIVDGTSLSVFLGFSF